MFSNGKVEEIDSLWEATEKYLDHFSPKVKTTKKKKSTIRPPFKIYFESMTVEVGKLIHLITRTLRGDTLMQDITTCT
jgi:hypothetical protein